MRQAQVLVRQAPVARSLGATGCLLLPQYLFVFASPFVFVRLFLFVCNIFFYLRSNLIRQPKQQNKINFLILRNPIWEFKFPWIFHQKPCCEMLGGLYGDLPPPSDEDKPTNTTTIVWSFFVPPQTILKPQSKPKTIQNSLPTRPHSSPAIAPSPDDVVALP